VPLRDTDDQGIAANTHDSHRRFFFVHVMKTGGLSLVTRLRHHFGGPAVYPDPGLDGDPNWAAALPGLLLERWEARRREVRLISGHFPPCTIELLGDVFTTLTLLREPVERTLSFLRHCSRLDDRFAGWPLEQIYDDPDLQRNCLVRDHMVSMFSITTSDVNFGLASYWLQRAGTIPEEAVQLPRQCDREDLARAETRLEATDVVGFQEHFDEFCTELTRRFGWRLGSPVHINQIESVATSKSFRDRIADDNALDIELYDFARRL
jgi:hypothetical protein